MTTSMVPNSSTWYRVHCHKCSKDAPMMLNQNMNSDIILLCPDCFVDEIKKRNETPVYEVKSPSKKVR